MQVERAFQFLRHRKPIRGMQVVADLEAARVLRELAAFQNGEEPDQQITRASLRRGAAALEQRATARNQESR